MSGCLNHQWGSLKHSFLGPNLAGLEWDVRICLSNEVQVDLMLLVLGPHFEDHPDDLLSPFLAPAP